MKYYQDVLGALQQGLKNSLAYWDLKRSLPGHIILPNHDNFLPSQDEKQKLLNKRHDNGQERHAFDSKYGLIDTSCQNEMLHQFQWVLAQLAKSDHYTIHPFNGSIVVSDKTIMAIWTQSDTGKIQTESYQNDHWQNYQLLNETSESPPAIIKFANNIIISWTGTENHWLNIMTNFNPKHKKIYTAIKTQGSPTLTSNQYYLFVSWINPQNHLTNMMHSTDGFNWSKQYTVDNTMLLSLRFAEPRLFENILRSDPAFLHYKDQKGHNLAYLCILYGNYTLARWLLAKYPIGLTNTAELNNCLFDSLSKMHSLKITEDITMIFEKLHEAGFQLAHHLPVYVQALAYFSDTGKSQYAKTKLLNSLRHYTTIHKLHAPNENDYADQCNYLTHLISDCGQKLEYGPLNKTKATLRIEDLLMQCTRIDPKGIKLEYKSFGGYFIHCGDMNDFNLTFTLKNANLSHLVLSDELIDKLGRVIKKMGFIEPGSYNSLEPIV